MGRFYSRVQFNFVLASVPAAEILQQLHESRQLIPRSESSIKSENRSAGEFSAALQEKLIAR
jgi:hypothetical protein